MKKAAAVLFCVCLAWPLPAAPKKVHIEWKGPMHLLDDFDKLKACEGLETVIAEEEAAFRLVVQRREPNSFLGGYGWGLFDAEGKRVGNGETLRGKNAVKDACNAVERRLQQQRLKEKAD